MEPSKKSFTGRKGTTEACSCNFEDMFEQAYARMNFLRKHGEALPESTIMKAVEKEVAENWVEYCDCQTRKDIVAAIHYENNDWYLCTMKNLAVKPETRGYGIGTGVVAEAVEKASQDPNCMVLAADITYDNKDSIRVFEKASFETVGEFCWGKGQKPADILHFIRFKPTQDKNCLAPAIPKAEEAAVGKVAPVTPEVTGRWVETKGETEWIGNLTTGYGMSKFINGYAVRVNKGAFGDISQQGFKYRIHTQNPESFRHQFYKTIREAKEAAEKYGREVPPLRTWLATPKAEAPAGKVAPVTPEVTKGQPFVFRGITFREYKEGIGVQVLNPKTNKWGDMDVLNRRTLERDYANLPDLTIWKGRTPEGRIQFPTAPAVALPEAEVVPEVNKQPTGP